MFALKNVAFFGHMDGWEYQDRVMALCSFMCDALCSVFPKTSNQAWGWAVPFWRIFNWKVKKSTRLRDKSCCHSSQLPPRPPLCVSLHYTYVGVLHPAHSAVTSFLRLRVLSATHGLPKESTTLPAGSPSGWGWMICGVGVPGTHLLMGLLVLHRCCALSAAWHLCVSITLV